MDDVRSVPDGLSQQAVEPVPVSPLRASIPSAKIEPPIGSPPTLEWVAVERLEIDEAYQRATDSPKSRSLIFNIGARWDWTLCQPLVVSRRDDGAMFVIDGQHRLAGALSRGDIPHLPCVVMTGRDTADEAKTFVALNMKRQRLSQADVFNALLASGDEAAKATAQLLSETGWRQIRAAGPTAPGQLSCGPMVCNAVRVYGDAVVRNALVALREAYQDVTVPNTSALLKALFSIYRENRTVDADLFIEALGSIKPTEWEMEASDCRRLDSSMARTDSFAAAIWGEYDSLVEDRKLAA